MRGRDPFNVMFEAEASGRQLEQFMTIAAWASRSQEQT